MKSVANLSNQLLRAGTSIGANNAEATNAISKADFKSKSFIALNRRTSERRAKLARAMLSEKEEDEVKEARESLYWINLLHRNNYIDDKQFESIYADCEELVRVLVHRCKKLNEQ